MSWRDMIKWRHGRVSGVVFQPRKLGDRELGRVVQWDHYLAYEDGQINE